MKLKKYKEICKLINEKQFQLLQKTKNTKKQTIEHPETAYKQIIKKLEKNAKKKQKKKAEKKTPQ